MSYETCNIHQYKFYMYKEHQYMNMNDEDTKKLKYIYEYLPRDTNIVWMHDEIEIELDNEDRVLMQCCNREELNEFCRDKLYNDFPYCNEEFNEYLASFLNCATDLAEFIVESSTKDNLIVRSIRYPYSDESRLYEFIKNMPMNIVCILLRYDNCKIILDDNYDKYYIFYDKEDDKS